MTLQNKLKNSLNKYQKNIAIEVGNISKTYGNLHNDIRLLSGAISNSKQDFIGIFGYRSISVYVGLLASIYSGFGYMPLNPKFPKIRLLKMLEKSLVKEIILCEECYENFLEFASDLTDTTVFCIDFNKDDEKFLKLKMIFKNCKFVAFDEFMNFQNKPKIMQKDDPIYLLFTSGSTGEPKGVQISSINITTYLDNVQKYYNFNENDRISQMFDLTFDLSAHDIFCAFLNGANLCVVPENSLFAPVKFIHEKKISVFFCVPSVLMYMSKFRLLKKDFLSDLRLALFCGEALPSSSVKEFKEAANNAKIYNLYGPTEATIAIFSYEYSQNDESFFKNDIVPIGEIFADNEYKIINDELCLNGKQIFKGYFKDEQKTQEKFIFVDEKLWYKTGDLVSKVKINDKVYLLYEGRLDEQIKLNGFRIELYEINKHLRDFFKNDMIVCVALENELKIAEKIYAFVQGKSQDSQEAISYLKTKLPPFMIPSNIIFIDNLPLNSNGKIDIKTLKELYAK